MQSIQEILKSNIQKDIIERHKYVSQEFQDYGYRLAQKLGGINRVSMYIKLAKNKPRALLEQAFSFAIDYPSAKNREKIFMWKLKELESERFETLKKKNAHIRIILLDLDGVVLNEEKLFSERYSERIGVDVEDMLPFFKGDFSECLVGKKDLKKVLKKVLKLWRWQGSVDELVKYWIEEDLSINDSVVNRVKDLDRNIFQVCICSNQEKYRAEYLEKFLTEKTGITKYFFSSQLRFLKKDPKFFNKVMDQFIVEPNQVYYLDDEEKNIRAAEKVGIKTYLYPEKTIDDVINDASTKS
ncbi:HAD-IA family hydrolase [Candidatus Dojkabacteria bacterium]|nr:HAD-IA family hydrolase [Candidatus Dojkabacteria bacterium]